MALERYDPPGGLTDFDGIPGQREAWSGAISAFFDSVIGNALPRLLHPGDRSQYVNQLTAPVGGMAEQRIVWNAFPGTLRAWFGRDAALPIADRLRDALPQPPRATPEADPNTITLTYRLQDEYCEWFVARDAQGRITSVTFTSEPPEYWAALHGDTLGDPVSNQPLYRFPGDRDLLVQLYRDLVSPRVAYADLVFDDDVYRRPGDTTPLFRKGEYNPYNRWNTSDGIVHLTDPVNSLGAEIVLGGTASVLRADRAGAVLADPDALICCAGFGGPNRTSDPTIGGAVNQLARLGCAVTLRNPVGLYMHHLDLAGFTRPDGSPVDASYFQVVRGDADAGMIERAVFSVPAGEGFTVSDLLIAGEPILYGGQVAERMTMNLVALAGPPGAYANQPVACSTLCCQDAEHPQYLGLTWRPCGEGQTAAFSWETAAPAPPGGLVAVRSRVADARLTGSASG